MVSKKINLITASLLALLCFLAAVYIPSCTKPGKGPTCDDYVCENGGYCGVIDTTIYDMSHHPIKIYPVRVACNCPTGTEGPFCATVSVTKYVGTWDVKQTVIGSDSAKTKGTDSLYSVVIQAATPTTFTIWNLCGDNNYNDVICWMDSTNTSNFIVDTLSAFHMVFDHFKQTTDGYGTIVANDSITAVLFIRHLNYNVNWQNDTLSIVMKPHQQ